MLRALVIAALVTACDGPAAEDAGAATSPDAVRADAAPPAPDAAAGPTWILVHDVTTGIAIGANAGADVDAVEWRCPDGRSGFGTRAEGHDGADNAKGAPDGPCDPPSACAVSLGLGGHVALAAETPALAGCRITVYEVADAPDEAFEVYTCPDPELSPRCAGPHFRGGDGTATPGDVP
jgi:hypothetical protein